MFRVWLVSLGGCVAVVDLGTKAVVGKPCFEVVFHEGGAAVKGCGTVLLITPNGVVGPSLEFGFRVSEECPGGGRLAAEPEPRHCAEALARLAEVLLRDPAWTAFMSKHLLRRIGDKRGDLADCAAGALDALVRRGLLWRIYAEPLAKLFDVYSADGSLPEVVKRCREAPRGSPCYEALGHMANALKDPKYLP